MALTPNPSSRYLRASLTGLIGGVLLAVAVTTGEFLVSAKRVWAQMASVDCVGVALSTLCTSSVMVSNLL